MNHPLPPTMKSPRDKRPGVWRSGVLQIHITRACDMSCIGCTQGSNLAGKPVMMTPDQFEEACKSLCRYKKLEFDKDTGQIFETDVNQPAYFGVVGIFGGNPCVSPYFEEICKIMQKWIPWEQRGLWSNNLMGHGKICRKTFNPDVSNLNVHLNQAAYDEIRRDWPMAMPKGLTEDSRHSPPYVAMRDMEDLEEEKIWELIGGCDVNQLWSAIICVFRGQLRGYFCELAGAQAMLHENEDGYPDLGRKIEPGWWNKPMAAFEAQVRKHCFECGHPLRGYGDLATTGVLEQVSKTHANIYKLKKPKGKYVQLVTNTKELGRRVGTATKYLPTEGGTGEVQSED